VTNSPQLLPTNVNLNKYPATRVPLRRSHHIELGSDPKPGISRLAERLSLWTLLHVVRWLVVSANWKFGVKLTAENGYCDGDKFKIVTTGMWGRAHRVSECSLLNDPISSSDRKA
jgi:hypothetical protein